MTSKILFLTLKESFTGNSLSVPWLGLFVFSLPRAWAPYRVRELSFHKLYGIVKNNKIKRRIHSVSGIQSWSLTLFSRRTSVRQKVSHEPLEAS